MTYKPLSSRNEIREAFEAFRDTIYEAGNPVKMKIGWPGGHLEATDVYWNSENGVWAYFDEDLAKNRYWCAFGVSEAMKDSYLSIACEINFPYEGVTRRVAGAFFTDGDNVYVGHSGKVGGGLKGVGKHAFRKYCEDIDIAIVEYPKNRKVELINIGTLNNSEFPNHVAEFVKKASGFKSYVRQSADERARSGKSGFVQLIDNGDIEESNQDANKQGTTRNWSSDYKTRGKPLTKKDVEDREIQGYPRSIRDLLQNKQYTIDFYQRDYKWETKHELLSNVVYDPSGGGSFCYHSIPELNS